MMTLADHCVATYGFKKIATIANMTMLTVNPLEDGVLPIVVSVVIYDMDGFTEAEARKCVPSGFTSDGASGLVQTSDDVFGLARAALHARVRMT